MPAARRLAVALVLAALSAPVALAQSSDNKRVLVLIAAERSDKQMVEMIDKDVDTFKRYLTEHLPDGALTIKELTGPELTATAVVDYYRKLDVKPTDALVFYYTGHGSFRGTGGADVHTLEMQVKFHKTPAGDRIATPSLKEALARPELKREMLAKKAALTVILTDCCSDHLSVPPPPNHLRGKTKAALPTRDAATAAGKALFLQAKGEVDLTAASKGQTAVCDALVGSYFTVALRRTADARRDKPVSWQEYVTAVKAETQRVTVEEIRKQGGDVAKAMREKSIQVPEAFAVKTTQLGADAPAPAGKATYAVIALDNPTDAPVTFQYRWGTTGAWSKPFTVQPQKYSFAARAQPAGKPPETTLQVKVNGQEYPLKAKLVTRDSKPDRAEDGNVYELPGCTPVGKSTGKTRGLAPDDMDPTK